MRNWDIRARAGREEGCKGSSGGRLNVWLEGLTLAGM